MECSVTSNELVPVILFAYARPEHLQLTLESLRLNRIPLIYAYSDGPGSPDRQRSVVEVRAILRAIDWCEVIIIEREENWGLGRSVLAGVKDVLRKHDRAIVVEDDLICVPGTYRYLCAAMEHYREDHRVMSVTGWTHPRVTPRDVVDQPYFDGRAECWVWGTWSRAWKGMDQSAVALIEACQARGTDVFRYGADLPAMAKAELEKNIWAVRFLYLHILQGGLCLRPPYSMVEHIGFDDLATNASDNTLWADTLRGSCPDVPVEWPAPLENPECPGLWQRVYGYRKSFGARFANRAGRVLRRVYNMIDGNALVR